MFYHWFEYMPAALLEKFTAQTGITVTMDTYDSNGGMLASLKAGGMGTYDVAGPGDDMVEIMAGEGLLDTIANGELTNKGNIAAQRADPSFDPGRAHSIPYQWGSTSFAVDAASFNGDINTTDLLFNPPAELSGKINVLDSQGEVMDFMPDPENIAAVSNYARYELGVTGAEPYLDPALATLPGANPPATAGTGGFIQACDP